MTRIRVKIYKLQPPGFGEAIVSLEDDLRGVATSTYSGRNAVQAQTLEIARRIATEFAAEYIGERKLIDVSITRDDENSLICEFIA